MKKNIGTVDKIIRGVLGLILIYVGGSVYTTNQVLSIIFFVVGLLLIITSMVGFCFLYTLLGITTKKESSEPPSPAM